MLRSRSLALVACALLAAVACGKDKSPTSPTPTTPTQTSTRVISLSGNLAFGTVNVGQSRTMSFTIANQGNSALTVSGMTVSGGLSSHVAASWTNGQIAAGAAQTVSVEFSPTSAGNFNGVVTVNGDQTSGSNTIAISGTAPDTSIAGTWTGTYVVERCDGTGSVQDIFCSANRGVYPVGTSLPLRLDLTQNGTSVSGTASFGQVRGPVSGNITGGTLTLQGTATSGQLSVTISAWSTRAQGTSMTGNVTYNASSSGIPGTAVVVTRISLTR